MSEPYQPSSGTEGCGFFAKWCENCAKDKPMSEGKNFDDCAEDEVCQIIGDSMAYKATDPKYPKEWTYDKDGKPCCTAFIPAGQPIPQRCSKTPDMFGGEA